MPEIFNPEHIELESMKIIQSIIDKDYPNFSCQDENLSVIKRVIHATADFDFLENLFFSENVVNIARNALKNHTPVITDTLMLAAGITKKFDTKIICNISDEKIKSEAKQRNLTRSIINIEHAAKNFPNAVYAIGNAPTALIKLCELIREGLVNPAVVIGVPVGFVNVIESKNLLESLKEIPRIIARGRKGGTTVACAILNAVLYGM
ncbi:MAG: precorrin-8X methylmutase [Synergistaceae bacterium]|nr:precorrin-8X methylmutase [Synergistaceae bacterium]MBR0074714.1 precorrin-8X methylmutase [Synergistaceae bacterium]